MFGFLFEFLGFEPARPQNRGLSWGMMNYGTDDPVTIYRTQFRRSMEATISKYEMQAITTPDKHTKDFLTKIAATLRQQMHEEMAGWE